MKLDTKRKLKRDVVVSMTDKGDRVGVYYADTDGSEVVAELSPEMADKVIAAHNAKVV